MAGTLRLLFVAGGLLVCGTFNSLIAKLIYGIQAPGPSVPRTSPTCIPSGVNGHVHYFRKPWFQTTNMFLGMTLCMAMYYAKLWALAHAQRRRAKVRPPRPGPSGRPGGIRAEGAGGGRYATNIGPSGRIETQQGRNQEECFCYFLLRAFALGSRGFYLKFCRTNCFATQFLFSNRSRSYFRDRGRVLPPPSSLLPKNPSIPMVRGIIRSSLPFLFARHHSCRSSSSLSPRLSAEIGGAASPGDGGGGRRPGDGAASQEGPPRPRHLRRRPRRHRSPGAGTRVRR